MRRKRSKPNSLGERTGQFYLSLQKIREEQMDIEFVSGNIVNETIPPHPTQHNQLTLLHDPATILFVPNKSTAVLLILVVNKTSGSNTTSKDDKQLMVTSSVTNIVFCYSITDNFLEN